MKNYKQKEIIKSNQKGFTLTETLIYLSIFIIVFVLLIQILTGIFFVFSRIRVNRGILNTGSSIIERITRNIRISNNFSETGNSFNTEIGSISIESKDQNGNINTYKYKLNTATKKITEDINGNGEQDLNGGGSTITKFVINPIIAGLNPGAIISLTITDSRINPPKTETFTTTVLMRGNY
jgi:type II secretory pathway pseudopilin PulG